MKLVVLDGNSIVNRAFYGVRMLNAPDGTPTNAIFGFLNILQKIVSDEAPDALCVTFDLKGPTFRHGMYEGYKATRKGMPEELAVQMPILKEILRAMNIPYYEQEGWEADDLIGTISLRCRDAGWVCAIVTGDRDSLQLIGDGVYVLNVRTRMGGPETKKYDEESFREEYGFAPENIVDLKALMGDQSDNIPGVRGVGEKTATDLIRNYTTVENIYGSLAELPIRDSLRKKLDEGRESAEMSKKLAEICRTVPLNFDPEENRCAAVDNDELYRIFERLNFTRLTQRFGLTPPAEAPTPVKRERAARDRVTVTESAGFSEAIEGEAFAAVAVEGDSVAVCTESRVYLLKKSDGLEAAFTCLFSEEIKKSGHNVKDMMRSLLREGCSIEGWEFDTALAAYLLDSTASGYSLESIAEKYCGIDLLKTDDNGQIMLGVTGGDESLAERAEAVYELTAVLEEKLAELGMTELYERAEMPLCAVLARMEDAGIAVDEGALQAFGELLSRQIDTLQTAIYDMAGEKFNINSPKQLGTVLFEKLMLPAPKKTKTGWSTNADVLEKLRNKHPIIELILEYRQLSKLKSTYADGLVKVIDEDGRIRTTFQMTVTATGRLSSTDPNLQNIPVRTDLGGEIRKMFRAGQGCVLVDADYSQIELRLLAHISGDETMREAFRKGEDIHRVTASQVLGIPPEEVTSAQRSSAKAVNFGIVYGISAFSLAQDIGVSVAEAGRYIDSYLSNYSGVRSYMKRAVENAERDGYVSTLLGRRRYMPELKSSNRNIKAFGERVVLNMPIQGTAADIMKLAMVNVDKRLRSEGLKARLLLQIHDELIVECPEAEAETVARLLKEEMEGAIQLSVPLVADTNSGVSWYDAK